MPPYSYTHISQAQTQRYQTWTAFILGVAKRRYGWQGKGVRRVQLDFFIPFFPAFPFLHIYENKQMHPCSSRKSLMSSWNAEQTRESKNLMTKTRKGALFTFSDFRGGRCHGWSLMCERIIEFEHYCSRAHCFCVTKWHDRLRKGFIHAKIARKSNKKSDVMIGPIESVMAKGRHESERKPFPSLH